MLGMSKMGQAVVASCTALGGTTALGALVLPNLAFEAGRWPVQAWVWLCLWCPADVEGPVGLDGGAWEGGVGPGKPTPLGRAQLRCPGLGVECQLHF